MSMRYYAHCCSFCAGAAPAGAAPGGRGRGVARAPEHAVLAATEPNCGRRRKETRRSSAFEQRRGAVPSIAQHDQVVSCVTVFFLAFCGACYLVVF